MTGWWAVVLALVTTVPVAPGQPDADASPVLQFSGKPKVGYVDAHVLHLPGGRQVQLPKRWGVTGIAAYDGGYLVSDDRVFEGTVGMAKLGADGKVLDQWSGSGAPVLSRDGRIAWVSLSVSEADQHGPTVLHADSVDGGAEVTQRISRHRMPILLGWFRGRLVYDLWGSGASHTTDFATRPVGVPLAEDLGERSPNGFYFVRSTRVGLEFRQYDGQLVSEVHDRGLTRTQVSSLAWEDDHHVLATLTRGHRMCVVRIDDRGRITRATDWRPSSTAGFAFVAGR